EVEKGEQRKPVADYVLERDNGKDWAAWLQTHRIELNAMTTPEFIAWLDAKMAEHGDGKLIPPHDVLASELEKRLGDKVRAVVMTRILREAKFEDQVAEALAAIKRPSGELLTTGIEKLFSRNPDREWREHIERVVAKLGAAE